MDKNKKVLNVLAPISPLLGLCSWYFVLLIGIIAVLSGIGSYFYNKTSEIIALGILALCQLSSIVTGIITLVQIAKSHGEQMGRA